MFTPFDRVFVEEFEPLFIAGFLPVVNKRNAFADDRKYDRRVERIAEGLELRSFPRILVVVADEHQPHAVFRVAAEVARVKPNQLVEFVFSGDDVDHDLVPTEGVGRVERLGVQVPALPLGQHEYRFDRVQFLARVIPELDRHVAGHIAAVTIDAGFFDPVPERIGHELAQPGLRIVQVDDVRPVPPWRGPEITFPVPLVPVRVLRPERIVPGRVIANPVDDDVKTELVRTIDEVLQVVERAELRVDAVIVFHRVGAAERAFSVLHADLVYRHEPHDRDAQFLQPRQLFGRGAEGALGRELPRVQLVDCRRLAPLGMRQLDVRDGFVRVRHGAIALLRGTRCQDQQTEADQCQLKRVHGHDSSHLFLTAAATADTSTFASLDTATVDSSSSAPRGCACSCWYDSISTPASEASASCAERRSSRRHSSSG